MYCNYSKNKFNNECTFIIPSWLDLEEGTPKHISSINETNTAEEMFCETLYMSEMMYLHLLNKGWVAQKARNVLPLALKTELVMTGTIEQWKGFFKLRDAKDAHPQARELAQPLHEEFIKRGLISEG